MLVGGLVTTGGLLVEEETPPPWEVLVLRLLVLVLVLVGLVVVPGVVTAPPGRHWEYQSFCLVQVDPEAQQVAPFHPLPPHWPLLKHIVVSYLCIDRTKTCMSVPEGSAVLALLDDRGSQGSRRESGSEEELSGHCVKLLSDKATKLS